MSARIGRGAMLGCAAANAVNAVVQVVQGDWSVAVLCLLVGAACWMVALAWQELIS